jgi:hypothetical protein
MAASLKLSATIYQNSDLIQKTRFGAGDIRPDLLKKAGAVIQPNYCIIRTHEYP